MAISNETITIETELVGTISIAVKDISTLTTDESVNMQLQDGMEINRRLTASESGKVSLLADPNTSTETQIVNLSDIKTIPDKADKPQWQGSISGGMTLITGNTTSEAFSGSIDLQRRSKSDRLTFGGELAHTSQKDDETGDEDITEDWWKLRSKYDIFLTQKFYVFGNGRYETDRVADLTRRIVLGGGPGYQWIETPATKFSTEAGIAEVIEEFEDNTKTTKEISYQFGSHFEGKLNKTFKLIHDFNYFPSMDEFSNYYLTSTAELRASLTKIWYANLKMILDFDSTPAEGEGDTDIKYMLGVGCEF